MPSPEQKGEAQPTLDFNGSHYQLFAFGDGGVSKALIGIPADLEPGSYKLAVGSDSVPIRVQLGRFPLQHLSLPPAKDNFDMSKGEKQAVEGAKQTVSPERLWHGPFVKPSKARVSTGFGQKRVVNGRLLKDYYHSGMDFAGGAGSPIAAAAAGTVILTGRGFKLHGNCVAIDHGQGVITFYIHMKSIAVKKGDHVSAGEQIGTIGATGRANGPHLHFSVYVNQVATNPNDWFAHSF
jgi:murein DD-endopeptidase MepM/ murein hydrolase activator NlpD